MYLVFADWEGEVSYGVDSGTYLLEVTDDEDAAMITVLEFGSKLIDCETRPDESSYIETLYEIPGDKRELFEKKYSIFGNGGNGSYSVYYREFKPGMFCGGAFYLE